MKKLSEKFFNNTCRVDEIIHLVGAIGEGEAADCLIDFFQEHDNKEIEKALGELPHFMKNEDVGEMERWELSECIAEWIMVYQKVGFLILFATPVMKPTTARSSSFSWGFYNTQWIYADTYDAALEKGFEWVKSCREKEKIKAGI